MTLKTSLIITGDSKTAKAEVDALRDSIDNLGKRTKDVAPAAQQLDGAIVKVGGTAKAATVAAGGLDGALVRTGASARVAAVATGAITAASTVATGAMTAFGISAFTVEAILTGGLSIALTAVGTLLGALASEWLESGDAADTAAGKVDRYTESINRLNAAQGRATVIDVGNAQVRVRQLEGQISTIDQKIASIQPTTRAGGRGRGPLLEQRQALQLELETANVAFKSGQMRLDNQRKLNALADEGEKKTSKSAAPRASRELSAATRDAAKAAQEAKAANEQLDATYGALIGKYDKAAASARDYAGELKDIADLVAGGKLTNLQAGDLVSAVNAVQLKKVQGELTADLGGSLPNGGDISKQLEAVVEAGVRPFVDASEEAADALRQGARNVYDILGDGNLSRALGGLLQDLGLQGSDPSRNLAGQIKKLGDDILGPQLSGSIGKAVGKGLDGAAQGQFASSIADAVGLKQSKTGAALGGAAGAFLPIPGGAFIGGLVGGTLGGLLTSSKTGAANITSVDGDASISGNSGKFKAAAGSTAASVQGGLAQIAEMLGGGLGGFNVTVGVRNGDFRVREGAGSLKIKKGAKDFNEDEAGAIAYAQMLAISQGAITGLSAQIQKALQSSPDIDKALEEALKVQEIEILVGGIGAQFTKEFRDLERQAEERVRIAQEYGFDVVAIEKKNAEDRLKLTDELLEQQVGGLQRLVKELQGGSLFEGSAVDRRKAILGQIDTAKADLDAGKDGAGDTLAGLYEQLNSVSKEVFGTTGQFAADRSRILNEAQAAIAKSNAQIEAASKANSDPALTQTNKALDENNDQNAQLIALMRALPGDIARVLAAGGGSGQINLTALARTQER